MRQAYLILLVKYKHAEKIKSLSGYARFYKK